MQTKNLKWIVLLVVFIFNTIGIFAATKQDKKDCITTNYAQGPCDITRIVCVTFQDKKNQDSIYDYIIVWEKVSWDCGIAGKGNKSGNTYEGDFKFRDINNVGYFNDNPTFDPGQNDSFLSFVASPTFDPFNPDNTFQHSTFEIVYRDKNTTDLTGVFELRSTDTFPLFVSYKMLGPAKMSGTWNTEIFEELSRELIDVFTNITPDIYPNPTNGVITMSINEPRKLFLLNYTEVRKIDFVKIVDIKGELVHLEKDIDLSTPHNINLQHLPTGTYFLKVIIGNLEGSASIILNK